MYVIGDDVYTDFFIRLHFCIFVSSNIVLLILIFKKKSSHFYVFERFEIWICANNHVESNSRCNLIFEFIVVFRHKKKKICFITEAQFVVFSFFSFFFGRIAISFRNISIKSEQYSAPIKSFQWPTNDSSTFCSFKGPQSVYIRRIRQSDIYLFNHEF